MERRLQIRARVAAIYQRYCPEKPLSHVDYLLAKYEGYEEDLIAVLVEKYGPEPPPQFGGPARNYMQELEQHMGSEHSPKQLKEILHQFEGMEDALMHEVEGRTALAPPPKLAASPIRLVAGRADGDRDEAFRRCLESFRNDMNLLSSGQADAGDGSERQAVLNAARTLEQQELSIRSLREELRAVHRRAEECQSIQTEELRRLALEMARAKVELLALERSAKPGIVPYSQLAEVENRSNEIDKTLLSALQLQRVYEKTIRTHLALFPVTPLRGKLRELNATLAARLDTL